MQWKTPPCVRSIGHLFPIHIGAMPNHFGWEGQGYACMQQRDSFVVGWHIIQDTCDCFHRQEFQLVPHVNCLFSLQFSQRRIAIHWQPPIYKTLSQPPTSASPPDQILTYSLTGSHDELATSIQRCLSSFVDYQGATGSTLTTDIAAASSFNKNSDGPRFSPRGGTVQWYFSVTIPHLYDVLVGVDQMLGSRLGVRHMQRQSAHIGCSLYHFRTCIHQRFNNLTLSLVIRSIIQGRSTLLVDIFFRLRMSINEGSYCLKRDRWVFLHQTSLKGTLIVIPVHRCLGGMRSKTIHHLVPGDGRLRQ
mmetsp:Transcript_23745/g.68270  ORF Transcript_23745/g.68270 Transcript_23745/m.68270 type:complete len:304 (+) Transcript_23745:477-1388(+)